MKKLLLSILVLSVILTANAQKKPAADTRLSGVDAELQKVLDTWKVAGFAVAVVEKNKIIYSKGFGYRDYEKKLPVTPNTLFAIGSCSKSFTSSLLGLLRQDGKLDFNDSPSKYISDLKFYNSEMNDNIIIKDLMSHRTGLPRHDYSWYLFPTFNRDSLVQRIVYQEPFTGVRKQWYYNNFGFLLQGVIAEHLTNKSWEDNVKEKLFKPLNMTKSNVSITELEKAEEPSLGYEVKKEKISKMDYYHIAAMAPAGSINSSVNEMSNWVMTWINGGKFNGKEILPSSYVNEAISGQMIVGGGLPSKEHPDVHTSNYGYGWFLASYKGHYRVEHGGNIDGFSASTSFFPSDSVGIVVLVNQNGSPVPSIVRNILTDRLLKVTRTDWNKELKDNRDKDEKAEKEAEKEKKSSNVKGTKPSHPIADYTGRFSHPGYGPFDVVLKNDSLFAQFKKMKVWLRHKHYDVFDGFAVNKSKVDTTAMLDPKFNFIGNDGGEISKVLLKIEAMISSPIEFKRTTVVAAIDRNDLMKYEGNYDLAGVVARVFLKGEKLFVLVPGQPEYELVPTGKHKFVLKNMDGFKVEFQETDKNITELTVTQPNGTFKAKKKG